MESFRTLLGQIRENGHIVVKCLHTLPNNEAIRYPGRITSAYMTLRISSAEYQQLLDWLHNDDQRRLSPMRIRWTSAHTEINIDLDDETLEIRSTDEQLIQDAFAYAQEQHLAFRSRRSRRQENWEPSLNRMT